MHIFKVILRPEDFPDTGHYPFNLPVFQKTKHVEFTAPVTFFVGENGTGKSTLLKAMCRKCGIHIWEGPDRVRFEVNPYENALSRAIDVSWTNGKVPGAFFGSQIFLNFALLVDEWAASSPGILKYYGGKSLVAQSHGQSLMSFFSSVVNRKGLYFLDEPETALSPKTQLELLGLLADASKKGDSQFIIASHSPILLSCPGATIFSFDHIPIQPVAYKETEHFKVYHEFMMSVNA